VKTKGGRVYTEGVPDNIHRSTDDRANRTGRWFRVGTAAVVACVVTACGGQSKSPLDASAADEAERVDRQRAIHLLVRLDDLPPGWAAERHQASVEDNQVEKELRACLEAPERPPRTADVDSDDFKNAQAQITSRVTFAVSADDARRDFALTSSPKFPACLAEVYKRQFGRGTGASAPPDVKAEPLRVEPLAEGLSGNRLTITTPTATGRDVYYADAFFMLSGRAQVSINFLSRASPPDPQLERAVATRVADRARG
jgi:hypothetical protein